MEVLNNSSSGHDRTRRKSDQQPSDDRSLDWGHRDGDILLAPVSPLSLSSILAQRDGCFDLLPSGSVQRARFPKVPLDSDHQPRAPLETLHDDAELATRCKRVLVDNALIKQRGQRRLYLAAGFLCWPDDNDATQTRRAPLLLYPVILARHICTDPDTTEHTSAPVRYELRLESDQPDINLRLLEQCQHRWSLELPNTSTEEPLSRFFTTLTENLQSVASLELDMTLALGTSSAMVPRSTTGTPAIRMPDLPQHFDAPLALAIAGNKNLRELHAVLTLIGDYGCIELDNVARNEPANTAIARLRDYATQLASNGLGHVDFQRLPHLADDIEQWTATVDQALQCKTVNELLTAPDLSTRHLIRLAGSMELLDKAPLALDQYRHADLSFAGTPVLLRRARHQARLIEEELAALQTWFDLDKVPPKNRLLSLVDELGAASRHDPELVDADYFKARRVFMEFSRDAPTRLTREHHRLLAQLSRLLRFRELFVNNTEYRLALGPGYRGLRTDWAALELMTGFAQEVSEVFESEALAARAMAQWDAFRLQFVVDLEVLLAASEAVRKLLRLAGTEWQNRPTCLLLTRARDIRRPLLDWQRDYDDVQRYAVGTPNEVLSQFAESTDQDARTEQQAGETRQRIDAQLQQGQLPLEALVHTLDWLREASRTATVHSLDIDAIIDQLRIA